MRVVIDHYNLYQPLKTDFKVDNELTYRKARTMLLDNILHQTIVFETIHVSLEPYSSWFTDIEKYCHHITPRSVLGERYPGIILPAELSDSDIHELGMLEISVRPTEQDIFKHFLGIDIPQETINIGNLYLLSQVCNEQQKFLQNNYISGLWKRQLLKMMSPDSPLLNVLLENIIQLDAEFSRILSEGIYCAKNKNYRDNWLHDHKRYFHSFSVTTDSMELLLGHDSTRLPFNKQFERSMYRFVIKLFQENVYDNSLISGYYSGEADAILELKPQLTAYELQQLNKLFSGHLTFEQLDGISKLCKPIFAAPPQITELNIVRQAESWISWAIDSFIPFKSYYDNHMSIAPGNLAVIESASEAYSDWYFANYNAIIRNTDIHTNLDIVTNIKKFLEEPETKVIWLIVDGLPINYTAVLTNLLKKYGINKVSLNYSFATLPTITEIAIPVMLAGSYERDIDISTKSRQELLQKALNRQSVIYSSNISTFKSLLIGDYDVCCLHTIEVDKLLHLNDHELDTSRVANIERLLETKVKLISEIMKDSTGQKVKLVISTDHGATKCLNKGQKIKNIRLEEAVRDTPGERCVPLNRALLEEQFDSKDMYILTKDVSNNKADWAIARGYRYFGKQDSGYRHGGLSPEETIVPVLVAEIAPLTQVQLSIRYIGERDLQFDKTERNFIVKIRNSGPFSVEILNISIEEDANCIFKLPVQIVSESEVALSAAIKLPRKLRTNVKDGKLDLKFELNCQILGEQIKEHIACSVTTTRDELEDFFNF